MEQQWEDPLLQPVGPLVAAAVHKQVLAPRVAVDVAVKQNVSTLQSLAHHHFGRTVFRTLFHARSDPLSIQIQTRQRATVVANNYTVGVQHWYYFEHEVVPEVLCDVVVRHQELQHAFDDKRGVAFSRVHSRCDYDRSPDCNFFWSRTEISDNCHFAVVASNCFAYYRFSYSIFTFWLTQTLKELGTV